MLNWIRGVFLLLFLPNFILTASILINEVAPKERKKQGEIYSGDWIELLVKEAFEAGGYQIKEGTVVLKELPPGFSFKPETYIILWVNGSGDKPLAEDERIGKEGENGALDLFSANSGLVSTDGIISIISPSGEIIDALLYENRDGRWTASHRLRISLEEAKAWQGEPVDSSPLKGKDSLGRRFGEADTNTLHDWTYYSSFTLGRENKLGVTPISPPLILITEVAPLEKVDWVELYNPNSSFVSLHGWQLFQRNKRVKIFPDFNFPPKSFLVIHFGLRGEDEVKEDVNKNTWRDFYVPNEGIIGTDSIITLENSLGEISDALVYSNRDGTWSASQQEAFDEVVQKKAWIGTTQGGAFVNEQEGVNWKQGKVGYALARKFPPQDTNTPEDWFIVSQPTPGQENNKEFKQRKEPVVRYFQASPNPCLVDSTREVLLIFELTQAAEVSLKIYTTQGKLVSLLKENAFFPAGKHQIPWLIESNSLKIGIYICELLARASQVERKVTTVVVAKKLK